MKLLILNYEYPPLGGGAGICSRYQAEGLAKHGHEVTVLTTWFQGEKELEQRPNFKLIRLKSRRKKVFRSNPVEMFFWAIKSFRYIRINKLYTDTELVLAHFTLPGGIVAFLMNLLYKKPYYIISHGQDIPWFSPRELFFYHLIFYFPIKWICSRASKITVLSEKRLRNLNSITSRKKRHRNLIIPNGCDLNFFSPSSEGKKFDSLKVLFVGRLTSQKDPFTLLKTARLIAESDIPFSIEIIGDGPLRKKMQQYINNFHLQGRVKFSGWVSKEELRNKYQSAHVLVITSRDEGMSLAMMEAIASGLYVLTTKVSGSKGLIFENSNGNFISSGNEDELAAALKAYYEDKFLENYEVPDDILGELIEKISWDNYVENYKQLIQV